jgi:4-amino-4-deoxy-L-arabinose transferase-like glycosyltransferase
MSDFASETGRTFWPQGLANFVDFAVASHRRAAAFLLLVSLLAFAPGQFGIPPIDRDEARFAQATKQMVESGDFIDIRFQDDFRYKKPVGIYWLQVAALKVAETLGVPRATARIGIYRIPSLIGAAGAVLLTYWAALAFVSRRAAILAGLMMASCILLGVEARLAKTDAMLLFNCVVVMGAMGRIYLDRGGERESFRRRWILPALFWSALAAGILLKGPLILMFAGLCAIALIAIDREARWIWDLRPVPGILWMLAIVAPWFIAIMLRAGNAFFADSVGGDMLSKVASAQESHGAPPGYFLVLFFVTFWPASLLAGLVAPSIWREWRDPATKFLLAWTLPSWIVFEIVITKLPHYVLPLYPAIAILIAARFDPLRLSRQVWLERGAFWWFVVPLAVGLAGVIGLAVLEGQLRILGWPFAMTAVIFGFRAWWLYEADGPERSFLRASAASVLLAIAIYGFTAPRLATMFPSARIERYMRNVDCPSPSAAAAGFHEPSLVLLVGTETRLTDGAGAAEFLRLGGCRFAFVETRQQRSFQQRADAIGLHYGPGPKFDGINISGGRHVTISIFRSTEEPQ